MDRVSCLLLCFILYLLTFSVPICKGYENSADATPKAHDKYRCEHEREGGPTKTANPNGTRKGGWRAVSLRKKRTAPRDHVKGMGMGWEPR